MTARSAWVLIGVCGLATAPLTAQEDFLFGKQLAPFGAAGMIGQRVPLANPLILQHGQNNGVWVMEETVVRRVSPEVEKHMLRVVRDKTDRNAKDDMARDYLITHTRQVDPKDLAAAADPSITYANLFGEPARYRGVAVRLVGNVRYLRRFDPPPSLRNDPEVKALYEAWISAPNDEYNQNPYCVLFSVLPPGLEVSDKTLNPGVPVTCDAYFFKLLVYQARGSDPAAGGQWHYAPMLVARTLHVQQTAAEGPEDPLRATFREVILPVIVCSAFAVILIGGGLLLFFRRGDKAVGARLRQTRDAQFVEPGSQEPEAETAPAEKPPIPEPGNSEN